jgi:hypothetical protein
MGWVILGVAVAGFVWLWIKASRSPRGGGEDVAQDVLTQQSANRGPRQTGGPM